MTTSGKESGESSSLCGQEFKHMPQFTSLASSAPMSSPALSLWSRKLALQSEELNSLLQGSTAKLHSHQQELNTLLNTCKEEITHAQKQLELASLRRDDEVDAQLATLRRLTQTNTDLLYALEAKLSLLETLHTIHQKLHSHDLIFRGLEREQENLAIKQDRMVDEQKTQTNMLKDILNILGKVKTENREGLGAEQVIQDSLEVVNDAKVTPTVGFKRQRRLLSDEDEWDEKVNYRFMHRQSSLELLSVEEMKEKTRDTRLFPTVENNVGGSFGGGDGGGGALVERPMKRKLLSTMDVDQFSDD